MFAQSTKTAVAAMTRLAEMYDHGATRLSTADIAQARQLHQPFLAKILNALAQAGLVSGSPGPGGGYTLARRPENITLMDVYSLFEREEDPPTCAFGGGLCGENGHCPVHDQVESLKRDRLDFLRSCTFDMFSRHRVPVRGEQRPPRVRRKKAAARV